MLSQLTNTRATPFISVIIVKVTMLPLQMQMESMLTVLRIEMTFQVSRNVQKTLLTNYEI